MIAAFREWWQGRAPRERVLLGVMFGLLAIVILWIGVVWPVEGGLSASRERLNAALDRNAAVRTKVAALKALPRGPGAGPAAPVAQIVGESAGEAGFTLERSQEQGPGRVDIAIASVRPQALFGWIAALEGQGVTVETLTAQPAGVAGAVSVQAVFKGAGQ